LKFLCIRNFFIIDKVRWTKGEFYNGREPTEIEKLGGVLFYIESNFIFNKVSVNNSSFVKLEFLITLKDYIKYFKSIEDLREEKLNKILND